MKKTLIRLRNGLDLTEVFKTKGDLKRWSAKRTLGGLIVSTACLTIVESGTSWETVTMCAIGIIPICLSFFEE